MAASGYYNLDKGWQVGQVVTAGFTYPLQINAITSSAAICIVTYYQVRLQSGNWPLSKNI